MPKPKEVDFITLRGKLWFARVLGDPVDNYDGDGKEWKLDFIITDPKDLPRLKKLGIADRVKQKEDYLDGEPHISVKQKTERETYVDDDGNTQKRWARRVRIFDVTGDVWPQDKLLGNGTIVDIKLRVADYGKGMRKGIYINGIRVLELVPYARVVFDELDEDDPYYQKANTANKKAKDEPEDDDDLDDDIPFD